MLVRQWIQTPFTANGPERGSPEGRVVLGASPAAAVFAPLRGTSSCPAWSDVRFRAVSQAKFDELRGRLAEISDLGKTLALLSWDQHVMMPARGAANRAEQIATVGRIA